MIKIAYLINSFDTSGAEKAMVRLCSNLDNKKYDITCIALQKGDGSLINELERNALKYRYFNIKIFNLIEMINLLSFIKKNNDSILVCSLFRSSFFGRLIGLILQIKVINWQHNIHDFKNPIKRLLINITNPMSDIIILDSVATYNAYNINNYFVNKKKLKIIPIGGLRLSDYFKSRKKKDRITIASIGRLIHAKGYDKLIPVAAKIINTNKNVFFKIAGDGKERKKLQKLIVRNKIQNNFILEGFVRDIPSFLSQADIYVQPSRTEGLSMTVVEAMASYLPIIASDVGGINESVHNNINGYLIKHDNYQEFHDRIEELINDSKLREKFGNKSREITHKKYDIKKMVSKFEELLIS